MAMYGATNPPDEPEMKDWQDWCSDCGSVYDLYGMVPGEGTCWECWINKPPEEQAKYGDVGELIEQYKEWRNENNGMV